VGLGELKGHIHIKTPLPAAGLARAAAPEVVTALQGFDPVELVAEKQTPGSPDGAADRAGLPRTAGSSTTPGIYIFGSEA